MTETLSPQQYRELQFQIPKRMKYRNVKTIIDGITFDSKKEAAYYSKLKLLVKSGDVITFERQVIYPIIINKIKVCTYIADFVVTWKTSGVKVIDVKGMKTPMYNLKKKLMKAVLDITIFEV